jgi:histidinol-phosphate aminotransferase
MSFQYERVIAPAGGLRLHLNENTAGCSPRVVEAVRALSRTDIAIYPDYDAVVDAAARRLRVPAERLVLTNGLDDGILASAVWALKGSPAAEPYEAIIVVPAFDMYAACVDAVGGRVVQVPLGPDFAFPRAAILAAITPRTRAIYLTDPNNPTGLRIPRQDLEAVVAAAHSAMVFVDEAYADFADATLIGDSFADEHPNVVIGRTFAKAYGLAGLRAGAVVGAADTMAAFRRTVPPYTLNVAAAVALPAAFEDIEYYDWYLNEVRASRTLLYEALDRHGVRYWPSAANFVLAHFGADLDRVIGGLAARQVIVRDRSRDPGCAGCARITTGVLAHTQRCVDALQEVLCGVA